VTWEKRSGDPFDPPIGGHILGAPNGRRPRAHLEDVRDAAAARTGYRRWPHRERTSILCRGRRVLAARHTQRPKARSSYTPSSLWATGPHRHGHFSQNGHLTFPQGQPRCRPAEDRLCCASSGGDPYDGRRLAAGTSRHKSRSARGHRHASYVGPRGRGDGANVRRDFSSARKQIRARRVKISDRWSARVIA